MEPCKDDIAGYLPGSSIAQHLRLDIDQTNLNNAQSVSNLTLAYQWYSQGKTCRTWLYLYFQLLLLFGIAYLILLLCMDYVNLKFFFPLPRI
jgi:hypothetical protein